MIEKRRKTIGVISTDPENIYQETVLNGIFRKAKEYGYDVLVFTTFVKATHENRQYLTGEANIYNIINFDLLDGVIVLSLTFKYSSDNIIFDQVRDLLREKCHCPVITIDEPMDDYEIVITDDEKSFENITSHVIEEHGCRKLYLLAGEKFMNSSQKRVIGFKRALEKHNIEVEEKNIMYGEFWYTLGERVASHIAAGELEKPDAIIAASDYIGLGFINEALKRGYKIPEDFIVTGFDGVLESRASDITLTTVIPATDKSGEISVIRLAEKIEGRKIEHDENFIGKTVFGMSCGCSLTNSGKREKDDYGYFAPYTSDEIDMRKFLQSYMAENLTETDSLEQCYDKIMKHAYLMDRSQEYFLCTCRDWETLINEGRDLYGSKCGYTDEVKISVYRCIPERFSEWENGFSNPDPYINTYFDSSLMLPKIFSPKREEPAVFYFTPVHFNGRRIGYSVIRFNHDDAVLNFIYQIWSRYVNNALEMMRVREQLVARSTRDAMTGLYNRNSLQEHLKNQFDKSQELETEFYVMYIDMNSLKYINDVYGHDEGDIAIKVLAGIINSVCTDNSVCIRMGGDEFLMTGQSADAYSEICRKTEEIESSLGRYNNYSDKPYLVTASFGSCYRRVSNFNEVNKMIKEADESMYEYKQAFKKTKNNADR